MIQINVALLCHSLLLGRKYPRSTVRTGVEGSGLKVLRFAARRQIVGSYTVAS